jgi:hypothetical protein
MVTTDIIYKSQRSDIRETHQDDDSHMERSSLPETRNKIQNETTLLEYAGIW